MLFTRCPECDTTFRVNDETLKKANGQVRCGRCASVFNAYAELHDPAARSFAPEETRLHGANAPTTGDAASPAQAPPAHSPPPVPEAAAAEPKPASLETASVEQVVAEAIAAADEATRAQDHSPPAAEAGAISATEVERVLAAGAVAPLPPSAYTWPRLAATRPRSRWWAAGVALALLTFGAQALHHFRSEVAGHPWLGPWVTAAYRALGAEVTPNWNVHQYEIVDWIATAEPNERGLGSLKITARIQNQGPLEQPYPSVQLRLKDRWEEAVGGRTFAPAEYLPADVPRERLMSPGETARAELEVVDPGPDAYGFELDVCIEVEASLITCGSDAVFL